MNKPPAITSTSQKIILIANLCFFAIGLFSAYIYVQVGQLPGSQADNVIFIQPLLAAIVLTAIIMTILMSKELISSTKTNLNENIQPTHDHLTQLLSRYSFSTMADQCVAMSKRYASELSIIHFDIDYLKSINDQYGQKLGDNVIKQVAATIQNNSRNSDAVFRFGGDEFVMLLPQTSAAEALKLAEKIRNKIFEAPVFSQKLVIEVGVSGGISELQSPEKDIEPTVKRAEQALYRAKEQGRDRIVLID